MAKRPVKTTVVRCVPRQDGGYLVVLSDKTSGVSREPLIEGQSAKSFGGKVNG